MKLARTLLLVLSVVSAAALVSAETRRITLYKGTAPAARFNKGPLEATLNYTDECVNLDNEWAKRVRDVNTHGHCVTLYRRRNCSGKYVHVYPGSAFQSLSDMDFSMEAASFERCDSNRSFVPALRPIYFVSFNDTENNVTDSHIYKSGCENYELTWWKFRTFGRCIALSPRRNCKHNVRYILPGSWSHISNREHIGFVEEVSSWSTCDLYYSPTCKSCPKPIYKGSKEYEFWMYLFSIYSYEYRNEFENRVKAQPNGRISWDFLYPADTVAERWGDQYQDALDTHYSLFVRLRTLRIGYLNFNPTNADILRICAKSVLNEKQKYSARFTKNSSNHDYAVHTTYVVIWKQIVDALDEVYRRWNHPEDNDCGKPVIEVERTEPTIESGALAEYGDDPWHVGIYSILERGYTHILICGGTLISRSMVLSAGHCFYNSKLKKAMNKTSDYEVYVAKFTKNYFTIDSEYQEVHQIKELIFSPKGYNFDGAGHHGSDIILIVLETPVTINEKVRPVCLDWEGTIYGNTLTTGQRGRIVGWGDNQRPDAGSEYLLKADLIYMDYNDCVGITDFNKVKEVTIDKFCGRAVSGRGAKKGDSGGGYVFEEDGRYILRGIVSSRNTLGNSSISTFTDVSHYIEWIRSVFLAYA